MIVEVGFSGFPPNGPKPVTKNDIWVLSIIPLVVVEALPI